MTVLRLTVIFCLTLFSGCTPAPKISDYGRQESEEALSAPVVIVGVTDSDARVGGQRPSKDDPKYPMQMHRVHVQVENVLRGELSDRTAWVYYFGFAGGFDGPRPLGFGRDPSRRILWLRRDAGVLRMACDGWDQCTMYVESGAHPGYSADPGTPFANSLADILFTRGQGDVNESKFAKVVEWGAPSTIPVEYLLKKYTHLALTETPSISAAACSQIWLYTQERASSSANREKAIQAMETAGCHCVGAPRGSPRCE